MRNINSMDSSILGEEMNVSQNRVARNYIELDGEIIGYHIWEVDLRTQKQNGRSKQQKSLDGPLNIFLPGHGLMADSAKNLIHNIAAKSSSKIVWSIDVDPNNQGDEGKAGVVLKVIQNKYPELINLHTKIDHGIIVYGWSHGGSEALLLGELDSNIIKGVVCLTPTGLVDRNPYALVGDFIFEGLEIFGTRLIKKRNTVKRVLEIGANIVEGIWRNLITLKSIRKVIMDLFNSSKKVSGVNYRYEGNLIILFSVNDSVVKWRDCFPGITLPLDNKSIREFQKQNFPFIKNLDICVIAGDHISPETEPNEFIDRSMIFLTSFL